MGFLSFLSVEMMLIYWVKT